MKFIKHANEVMREFFNEFDRGMDAVCEGFEAVACDVKRIMASFLWELVYYLPLIKTFILVTVLVVTGVCWWNY